MDKTGAVLFSWLVSIFVGFSVLSASSQVAPTTGVADTHGLQERAPRYLLRPGDVIDLTFEFNPEFDQTVTVQPDGFISLKGAPDMHVSALSLPELVIQLRAEYSKFLHEPVINAFLKQFEHPYFVVGGMVAHPGKYDLAETTTIVEAVQIAGGFSPDAKHSQVLLFRRVSDQWDETKVLDVKKMLNSKTLAEDLRLRSGDMIFVPQSRISKIERFIPRSVMTLNPTTF